MDAATYWIYVANESSDLVSRVRFDGHEAVEERAIEVGYHPTDLDGAHGISISPDGRFWYVSFAHGQPYGQVWKMRTGSDDLVDSTTVGLFPATMALSPDGSTLFAVNFNLHGDPVASTVSSVFTPFMAETGQLETCVRPHGSRVSHDGLSHYSGCLLSDQLVEISTTDFAVKRRLRLSAGHEGLVDDASGTVVPPRRRVSPDVGRRLPRRRGALRPLQRSPGGADDRPGHLGDHAPLLNGRRPVQRGRHTRRLTSSS